MPARCCGSQNQGTIELHTFLARGQALEQPAGVLFDLDPEPPAGLPDVCRVALALRDRGARADRAPR
jgi:DNA primase